MPGAEPSPLIASAVLTSPAETARLAHAIAGRAGRGDTLLLDGPIGAGKTHFARALIRSLQAALGVVEDVPSPTYTLVQTYVAGELEIWHCDLYRLSHPDELIELGLDAAFGAALVLVEWPDRLGVLAPPDALRLDFAMLADAPDARRLTARGAPRWSWMADLMAEAADD